MLIIIIFKRNKFWSIVLLIVKPDLYLEVSSFEVSWVHQYPVVAVVIFHINFDLSSFVHLVPFAYLIVELAILFIPDEDNLRSLLVHIVNLDM